MNIYYRNTYIGFIIPTDNFIYIGMSISINPNHDRQSLITILFYIFFSFWTNMRLFQIFNHQYITYSYKYPWIIAIWRYTSIFILFFPYLNLVFYNKLDHKIVFYRSCSTFTLHKNGHFIAFFMKVIIVWTTKNRDWTISKHYNMNSKQQIQQKIHLLK